MTWINLNEKEKKLCDLLMKIPPAFDEAEKLLVGEKYSSDEVTKVAIEYAEDCMCDAGDYTYFNNLPDSEEIVDGLHSTYIYEVIKFLLKYGLEVNEVYDNSNIMFELMYIDNEYLAADAIALLLENGADINVWCDGDRLFDYVDFDVFFDAVEQEGRMRYASWVHCWMVMMGYGGWKKYRTDNIKVFKEYNSPEIFSIEKLKNHRNYYFGLSYEGARTVMHIYDKNTLWEVARII